MSRELSESNCRYVFSEERKQVVQISNGERPQLLFGKKSAISAVKVVVVFLKKIFLSNQDAGVK